MFKNLCPHVLGISGRESEIIELALSHGFKGINLNLAEFAEQAQTQGFAKASRLIASARLKLGSFSLPVRWHGEASEYEADMKALPGLADLAAQIGCKRAVTTIEPGSKTRPYHENFEFHRRRLSELGDALGKHGIRLGVGFLAPVAARERDTLQFMQKAEEVVMLLSTVGSSNVGLALDTFDWHLGGGTAEGLRALRAAGIVTVSLGDIEPGLTASDAPLSARRLPGEGGLVDNAAILMTLAELGYDGPVTPTADKSRFAGERREEIVKRAATAFDAAWKAAGLNASGKLAGAGRR
jgi:sugar phosphate isomerase/epimerase